jgi:transcriptional regulator with XRE-family HTH domain
MSSIDHVLSDFIDAWNAGRRPRVDDYLERVLPAERDALATELERWLEVAATPAYDADARRAVRAEPALLDALAGVAAEGTLWPELLPRLRERTGLRLDDVAARITAAFGLTGEERRAEGYLAAIERGELAPARVSRRLLDALARLLGVTAERLASAGGAVASPPAPAGALFRAEQDAAADFADELDALSRAALTPAPQPMDELDRLFLGGPDA